MLNPIASMIGAVRGSRRIAFGLAAIAALALPTALAAQESAWEVSFSGGAVRNDLLDDDATDLALGGRVLRYSAGGWGFGAGLDWVHGDASMPTEGATVDVGLDQFLYGLLLDKSFAVSPRARLVVGSGVGAATTRYSDLPGPADGVSDESESNLWVPVGAGIKLLNRAEAPSWALRFDVRDNLVFLDDEDPTGAPRDDEISQQWQASAGISFFLGGPRRTAIVRERTEPAPIRPVAEGNERDAARERLLAAIGEKIFFDFDRYELKPHSREVLQRKAEALRALPDVHVVIEGHADERGTVEYNLALGERRANAAKGYLVDLGIDPDRLTIVSYGEERPAVDGHNEAAWSQNRRDEFVTVEAGSYEDPTAKS